MRSGKRRGMEDELLAVGIQQQLARWRKAGDWQKIQCMELLFVVGRPNKEVADTLGLTEQQVANFKFDFREGPDISRNLECPEVASCVCEILF